MPINFDLKKYLNEVYLETGFYKGESLTNAINVGFKNIHSIEINEDFYNEGIQKFKKSGLNSTVFLYNGTSRVLLKNILEKIDGKITFFLDAHDLDYKNTNKSLYSEVDNCPIIEEIDIIKNHHIKNHTIIIDDIRVFDGLDNNGIPYSWAKNTNISSQVIKNKILEINSDYKFIFEKGIIDNDVLVAYV